MTTFTIDSENNIVAHSGKPAKSENQQKFSSEKELAKLAARWPASRLAAIWNSFAGVTPFHDLKPVKKFTSRETAVARMWEAIARLTKLVEAEPPSAKQRATKAKPPSQAQSHAHRKPANKKAQVIAMMRRPNGVSLDAIMEATGWQKHTVRGFISILGRKGGYTVDSSKDPAGHRTYRIAS
jgi:hypothetical protein